MATASHKEGPKDARSEPMGPYSPPLPTEAERTKGEPMAAANDKQTSQGKSFLPTTQSKDAYDREVAKRWEFAPGTSSAGTPSVNPREAHERAGSPEKEKPETLRQELETPGFTEVDERGFKHLKWDEDEASDKGE